MGRDKKGSEKVGKQSDDEPCAVQKREGGAERVENSCTALIFVEMGWGRCRRSQVREGVVVDVGKQVHRLWGRLALH